MWQQHLAQVENTAIAASYSGNPELRWEALSWPTSYTYPTLDWQLLPICFVLFFKTKRGAVDNVTGVDAEEKKEAWYEDSIES